MWMRVDGPETSPIAFDNMAHRAIRGDNDWSRYEIVLDVPAIAAQIAYGAILGGEGRLWVDDLTLEVVGADVATTDMHQPAVPSKPGLSSDLPRRPVNAGFEE
jgi:serine/threonine-protein kinase